MGGGRSGRRLRHPRLLPAYGMAVRLGIDLDRVLAAIVESNMTKEPNGLGKIKKGEAYVPPKIAEALAV